MKLSTLPALTQPTTVSAIMVRMNNDIETTKKLTIATTLLWVAAIAALGAAISAIPAIQDADNTTKVVETWRMIGFGTFAAMFTMLARKPHGNQLWWIVIGNKLALTIAGIIFVMQGGIKGALDVVIFDGGLTILLLIAFVLMRSSTPKTTLQ